MIRQVSKCAKIRQVILDGSGTIADAGVYAPAVAFQQVYQMKGVPISMAEAREPMGNHKKVHIELILSNPAVRQRWHQAHGREPNKKDVDEMFDWFRPLQLKAIHEYGGAITGAVETCEKIKQKGISLGFTTGFTREMTEKIFSMTPQFTQLLDTSVAADEVPIARPAPFMIYRNMEKSKVIDPWTVIKVDDTEMGMQEGVYAGCWRVGLSKYSNLMAMTEAEVAEFQKRDPKGYQKKLSWIEEQLYEAGAHYVVDDITHLPRLIDTINQNLERGQSPNIST